MHLLKNAPGRIFLSTAVILLLAASTTLSLGVRPSSAATGTSNTGIVIPLYTYPTDSTWATVIQVHNAHPNVPMIVIADPTSSGAGTAIDQNYVSGIQSLQAAGIKVLGYVDTVYAGRALSSAENDATNWWNWYHPNGIFFDEFGGSATYYSTLNTFVKALGVTYTMGNPGTTVPSSFYGTLDSLVISENPSYPTLSTLSSATSGYPKSEFGYLAYGVSLDTSYEASSTQYVGWLYITSAGGGNPWNTLPSYFSNEVAALDTGPSLSTTTTKATTSTSATSATTTFASSSLTTASSTTSRSTSTATTGSGTSQLTVSTKNTAGTTLINYWTQLWQSGVTIASGYTSATYTLVNGQLYTIEADGYGSCQFDHWQDNGNTNGLRDITITSTTSLVAVLNCGATSTTTSTTISKTTTASPGTATITVQSVNLAGAPFTGMWTTIHSLNGKTVDRGYTTLQFTGLSGATYTVCVSNYLTNIFSHWGDGSTNPCKTVTPTSNIVMTAYYVR